jgi:hypothetical protein
MFYRSISRFAEGAVALEMRQGANQFFSVASRSTAFCRYVGRDPTGVFLMTDRGLINKFITLNFIDPC